MQYFPSTSYDQAVYTNPAYAASYPSIYPSAQQPAAPWDPAAYAAPYAAQYVQAAPGMQAPTSYPSAVGVPDWAVPPGMNMQYQQAIQTAGLQWPGAAQAAAANTNPWSGSGYSVAPNLNPWSVSANQTDGLQSWAMPPAMQAAVNGYQNASTPVNAAAPALPAAVKDVQRNNWTSPRTAAQAGPQPAASLASPAPRSYSVPAPQAAVKAAPAYTPAHNVSPVVAGRTAVAGTFRQTAAQQPAQQTQYAQPPQSTYSYSAAPAAPAAGAYAPTPKASGGCPCRRGK